MSNTWRTYGGMRKTKAISKFDMDTIVTDNIIRRTKVTTNAAQVVADANLIIQGGDIRVDSNSSNVGGNLEANVNIIVEKAGLFGEDVFIDNRLYFVPNIIQRTIDNSLNFGTDTATSTQITQVTTSTYYLNYITGNSQSGNIGVGLDSPLTRFDVFGNIGGSGVVANSTPFNTMRVVTNNSAGRTTLIELSNNVYTSGIDAIALNENSSLNFYNENVTSGTGTNANASVSYTSSTDTFSLLNGNTSLILNNLNKTVSINVSGNSMIDISSTTIQLNGGLSLAAGKSTTAVFDEALLIMDISGGGSSFLESYFPDSSSNYKLGNGLSMVADELDGSSNIMIHMVSKDANSNIKGLTLGGGVHPEQRTKSVGFIGLHHEVSSTSDTSFVPTSIIMEGSNTGYNRTTMGVNTLLPRTNDYTMDINGKTHIGQGETHIRNITTNQIYSMAFSKEYPLFGAAVGSVDAEISNTPYSYYAYVTSDGGQNWSKKTIVINDIQVADTLEVHATGSSNIHITTRGDSINKVYYYSSDSGETFSKDSLSVSLGSGKMDKLYVSKQDTNYYAVINDNEPTLAGDVSLYYFLQGNTSTFQTLAISGINEIVDVDGSGNVVYALGTDSVVRLDLDTTTTTSPSLSLSTTVDLSSGGAADYTSLYVYDTSYAVAVGNSGCVAFTVDGSNWGTATTTIGDLYNVHMVDNEKAIALYNDGGTVGIAYADISLALWNIVSNDMLNANGVHSILTDKLDTNSVLSTANAKYFAISNTLVAHEGNATQDISATSMLYYNHYPALLDKTNAVLDVSGALCIGGHVVPDVSGVYDLGSAIKPFRSLYVTNNSIHLVGLDTEDSTISVANGQLNVETTSSGLSTSTDLLGLTDGIVFLPGDLSMNGNIVMTNTSDRLVQF
jgi:hypothetical protein